MASTPPPSQPDEKDLGPDDSVSTVSDSSTIHLRTPTSSSVSTSTSNRRDNIPYITRDSAPGPGSTYIIAHKSGSKNQALAVVGGKLSLMTPLELLPNPPVIDPDQAKAFAGVCNWHWKCEESDGWLGFRNAATGLLLGTPVPDKTSMAVELRATASSLSTTEQFCVRKATCREGYVLLKRLDIKKTVYLLPVRPSLNIYLGNGDNDPLQTTKSTERFHCSSTWEFVKVDHDVVSYRLSMR
ncbi:hypothetical protein QBC45DRAFT_236453 [Copromyces sp. CBS 386.78]|nr:hypothetical protein QBC45DRAFT_236453 [Copromyces sp. CBS 386.78]